jgi:hypothetical protein
MILGRGEVTEQPLGILAPHNWSHTLGLQTHLEEKGGVSRKGTVLLAAQAKPIA